MKPFAHIVAGLTFGDEGKGTATDFLARCYGAKLIVRYNGGPQCAHNVVLPDGRHHTFAQFGSAYFVAGTETYLSRHMLVEPFSLTREAMALKEINGDNPFNRITIDEDCLIITPFHWMMNRYREFMRDENRHGTCGHGVGETRSDFLSGETSLFMRDLKNRALTAAKLQLIRQSKIDMLMSMNASPDNPYVKGIYEEDIKNLCNFYRDFRSRITLGNTDFLRYLLAESVSIFEGAQGILLDEKYGFAPYYTWTDTTFANAHEILNNTGIESTRIGVMRTYMTRHGNGPMPTESSEIEHQENHNKENPYQGQFRFGHLDMMMLKYSLRAAGPVDHIFLTHADKNPSKVCVSYDNMESIPLGVKTSDLMIAKPKDFIETKNITRTIENHLNVRVGYVSKGPTFKDKAKLMSYIF